MIVAERLAERIKLAGFSYSALAREIGVKQPTISRLVKGEQQGTTHLHRIAQVLGTTPAYLSGDTDNPAESAPAEVRLSADQREWLAMFDALTAEERKALRVIARGLAANGTTSARLHDNRQSFGMPDQG